MQAIFDIFLRSGTSFFSPFAIKTRTNIYIFNDSDVSVIYVYKVVISVLVSGCLLNLNIRLQLINTLTDLLKKF